MALGLTNDFIVAGVVTFSQEETAPAGPPAPPIARGPKTKAGQTDERLTSDASGRLQPSHLTKDDPSMEVSRMRILRGPNL